MESRDVIAAERLAALHGSGVQPFRELFQRRTHDLATRTLCAAAAARAALMPLLGTPC